MTGLLVQQIGPACSLQDLGRPGYLDRGLSCGGAADVLALHEGAALLGQSPGCAALEMSGLGGRFVAQQHLRIALTGAPMQAVLDDKSLIWNASYAMRAGQVLSIGGARAGVYGYLHVGGGFDAPQILGSRAAHLTAGIGELVQAGDALAICPDPGGPVGQRLPEQARFAGGPLRVLAGFQTPLFAQDVQDRFQTANFQRAARANRMGVQVEAPGQGFAAQGQLNVLSEIIVPGDIQMTGDGQPFVLMSECQTTGGYPRIGTVLPCDLPLIAQAPLGTPIRFQYVDRAAAMTAQAAFEAHLQGLRGKVQPLLRSPAEIGGLLSYQLISGAISATAGMEDWG